MLGLTCLTSFLLDIFLLSQNDVKRIRTNLAQLSQTVNNDLKPFLHSESSNLQTHCEKDIAVAKRTKCLIGNISLTTPFIKNFLCIIGYLYHGANQHSMAK